MPISKRTKRTKRTKSQKKTKIQKGRGDETETIYSSTVLLERINYLIKTKNIITNVTLKQNNTNLTIDNTNDPITYNMIIDLLMGIPNKDLMMTGTITYKTPNKDSSNITNKQKNLNNLTGSSNA